MANYKRNFSETTKSVWKTLVRILIDFNCLQNQVLFDNSFNLYFKRCNNWICRIEYRYKKVSTQKTNIWCRVFPEKCTAICILLVISTLVNLFLIVILLINIRFAHCLNFINHKIHILRSKGIRQFQNISLTFKINSYCRFMSLYFCWR